MSWLFKSRKGKKQADQIAKNMVRQISESFESAGKPISPEEYSQIRQREIEWLETHYDLSSAAGIASIPERSGLPRPPFGGVTGSIDYYLRNKSAEYENHGNIELAILCLQKSNAIRMACRSGYRKNDYYRLVRLLAQNGFVEEAKAEKAKIDRFFGKEETDAFVNKDKELRDSVLQAARALHTDLVIMSSHENSCTECAKYQGRVFSLSGKSSKFPKIPDVFFTYGAIHEGCRHSFSPYCDGISSAPLKYTLSIQKTSNKKHSKNIVTFSNRPFVDDRPPEVIEEAARFQDELKAEAQKRQIYYDTIIEKDAERWQCKREFNWIQSNLPELCPKSLSGYRRMKSQNTKNYQKIKALAAEKGVKL